MISCNKSTERIDIIDPGQLKGSKADQWNRLRRSRSQFSSPYFDIEFIRAVARVRNDIEIAVCRDSHGQISCFLPFQRIGNRGEPVGGKLNDVHGIIGDPDNTVALIKSVMQTANLGSFAFHASVMDDPGMSEHVFKRLDSHFIDIPSGWAPYRAWYLANSSTLRRQAQKSRALSRDVGPIRLEFECRYAAVLERLIELKRSKYQRTKTFDILSVPWAADLLRELFTVKTPGCQGLLSAMYAGEHLVAVHFGLLNEQILHYWFPTFDPRFAKYSPGSELLLRVTEEASQRGIRKIDLGYGDDAYKHRFCNGREQVNCGRVTTTRLEFELAKRRFEIRQKLKQIPMKPLAKSLLRLVYPGFGQGEFK